MYYTIKMKQRQKSALIPYLCLALLLGIAYWLVMHLDTLLYDLSTPLVNLMK